MKRAGALLRCSRSPAAIACGTKPASSMDRLAKRIVDLDLAVECSRGQWRTKFELKDDPRRRGERAVETQTCDGVQVQVRSQEL